MVSRKTLHLLDLSLAIDSAIRDLRNQYHCDLDVKDTKETVEFMLESINDLDLGEEISKVDIAVLGQYFTEHYRQIINSIIDQEPFDEGYIENFQSINYPTERGWYFITRLYYWLAYQLVTTGIMNTQDCFNTRISIKRVSPNDVKWMMGYLLYYTSYIVTIEEF